MYILKLDKNKEALKKTAFRNAFPQYGILIPRIQKGILSY